MKIAAPWPLSYEDIRPFAEGLEHGDRGRGKALADRNATARGQLLYGTAHQPVVVGKRDEQNNWLFPVKGALDPNEIAVAIGERILRVIGQKR